MRASTPPSSTTTSSSGPALLDERAALVENRAPNTSDYLLTGMLRCRACGGAYFGAGTKGRNGFYRYYACRNRQTKGTYGCRSGRVPAEDLETAVINDLMRTLSRSDLFEQAIAAAIAEVTDNRPRFEADEEGPSDAVKQLLRELIDRVEITSDRHAYPYFWVPVGCKTHPASGKPAPNAPPVPTHQGDTGWLFTANRGGNGTKFKPSCGYETPGQGGATGPQGDGQGGRGGSLRRCSWRASGVPCSSGAVEGRGG